MVIMNEFSYLTNHVFQFCTECFAKKKSKCSEESDQNKPTQPALSDNMATSLQFE